MLAPSPETVALAAPERSRRRGFGLAFWLAAAWLTALVVLAVGADVLPFVQDPSRPQPGAFRASPSLDHWFGGDAIGRDVFSRVVYGARVSLGVGVSSVALGLLIGGTLGLLAGYFRGWLDAAATAATDVLLAFPALILLLALIAFLGQNVRNVIVGVTVLAIPALFRISRAATLHVAQLEYVLAARAMGFRHRRVILREVLPNVVPPMLSFAVLSVAVVIVAEGALSFLGLSVAAPTPTWGNLINEGRSLLDDAPHITLIPCGVMFITLLALNHVGDRLRARLDPRQSGLA
jgi:peptide/nickel transport system permease protein